MRPLNGNVLGIQPSATLAIAALAKDLAAQGHRVCNFSAGEPDFDTPAFIKDAAIEALRAGKTKYTPAAGLAALCEAIAAKLQRENGIACTPSQVVVSAGAKHSLALTFQVLLNPGDEVLIPSPCWLSYPEMVRVAGGVPVSLPGAEARDYKIVPDDIERALTPRTSVLLLNSPSNPIGHVYDRAELQALAETAVKRGLTIVSDEIYEKLVFDGAEAVSVAALSPAIAAQTVTINGFSKSYAMTGWRLGYAVGPAPFARALTALQSHCASAPTTFAQYGGLAALARGAESIALMAKAFDERRRAIYDLLQQIPGVRCVKPRGAFYVLPNIARFGLDSVTFARRLLEAQHVAVVPGEGFGADACVRLSYACGLEDIALGLDRMRAFCASLGA